MSLPMHALQTRTQTRKEHWLTPITLPYTDRHGYCIQLWLTDQYGMIGSVLDLHGRLTVIPERQILNPCDPRGFPKSFTESTELRSWDIVFDIKSLTLSVWPHLKAAGKGIGEIPRMIRGRSSPFRYSTERELIDLLIRRDFTEVPGSDGKEWRLEYDPTSPNPGRTGFHVHFDPEGEGRNHGERTHIDIKFTSARHQAEKAEVAEGIRNKVKRKEAELQEKLERGEINPKHYKYQTDKFEKQLKTERKGYNDLKKKWRFAYGETKPPSDGPKAPSSGRYADPGVRAFERTLQQTGLTASYNSAHPSNPMPEKGMTGGEIGGVACTAAYIANLFNDPESPFITHHTFCFPALANGDAPFSAAELKQILRELAIGIYVHGTVPFFSLHFQVEGTDLFPVIHPAYANTLVGRVIGMLDYIMKGYLNGGVYHDAFIDTWHKRPDWETKNTSALEQLIEFTKYCKIEMGEEDSYVPLASLCETLHISENLPQALHSFHGFKNAFRIIAKQTIEKHHNLLVIHPDFDVHYDINPTPAYSAALDEYVRKHGDFPSSYLRLRTLYQLAARNIHDHMQTMPLCKKYFAMLGVISFFSSYFCTLKAHRKEPDFSIAQRVETRGCPPLFPHLPITQRRVVIIQYCLRDVGHALLQRQRDLLKECIYALFCNARVVQSTLSEKLQTRLSVATQETMLDDMWKRIGVIGRRIIGERSRLADKAQTASEKMISFFLEASTSQMRFAIAYNEVARDFFERQGFLEKCLSEVFDKVDNCQLGDHSNSLQKSVENLALRFAQIRVKRIIGEDSENKAREIAQRITQSFLQQAEDYILEAKKLFLQNQESEPEKRFGIRSFSLAKSHVIKNYLSSCKQRFLHLSDAELAEPITTTCLNIFKKLPSEPIIAASYEAQGPWLPTQQETEQRQENNEIVGGCGIAMRSQRATDSPESQKLWQTHRERLTDLEEEKWHRLEQEKNPMIAFNLPFYDMPVAVEEDCTWMESTLVDQFDESRELWVEMQKEMRNENRDDLSRLLGKASPDVYKLRDSRGRTLLHFATTCKDPFFVKALLKKECAMDARDAQGYTPLHYAAMTPNIEVLKALYRPSLLRSESLKKETPLSIAILYQNTLAVDFFLSMHSPLAFLIGGYTDLHSALHEGNRKVIDLILNSSFARACVNVNSIEGGTPLMLACELDDPDLVQRLIKMGANVSTARRDGMTATEIAIQRGNADILAYLLQHASPSLLAQEVAAREGAPHVVKILHPFIFQFKNASKDNALHIALRYGNLETALFLIQESPNPQFIEETNVEGETPMVLAAHLGDWRIVQALLKKRGKSKREEARAPAESSFSPLFFWRSAHRTRGVQKKATVSTDELTHLLKAPYHPFLKDVVKATRPTKEILQTYVLTAIQAGNYRAISEVLLLLGAQLEHCTGPKGWTILHYLAKSDGIYLFRFLTQDPQADVQHPLKEEKGITLAGIAARSGSRRVLEYLLSREIPLHNAQNKRHLFSLAIEGGTEDLLLEQCAHEVLDEKGSNAAHVAAQFGNTETLKKLAEKGVNLTSANLDGCTPLDYAVRAQAKNIVDFLLEESKVPVTANALYWAAICSKELLQQLRRHVLSEDTVAEAIALAETEGHREAQSALSNVPLSEENVIQDLDAMIKAIGNGHWDEVLQLFSEQSTETLLSPLFLHTMRLACEDHYDLWVDSLVSVLSDRSWNVNVADPLGKTALFHAIEVRCPDLVSLLIKRGANVEHRDHQLLSPLAVACQTGSLATVKQLIQEGGADPNSRITINKVLPVFLAALHRFAPIVQYLLSHGADPMAMSSSTGTHLIHLLAQEGYNHLLRLLLARGIPVELPDSKGQDAKFYAAAAGKIDTLKMLLSSSQEPLTQSEGESLLRIASLHGHEETVRWLMSEGVVPLKEASEKNPFIITAAGKNTSAILSLYDGYRVSIFPPAIRMALLSGIHNDNLLTVKQLYTKNMGVNLEVVEGLTGLHIASQSGALLCTQWLLSAGADPLLPSLSGETPLELSARNDSWEQFRCLLDYVQPKLDTPYRRGETLMHIAAGAGNALHLAMLLEEGAISLVNVEDNQHCTPLYRAAEAGHEDTVHLLLASGAHPMQQAINGKTPIDVVPEEKMSLKERMQQFAYGNIEEGILHRAVCTQSLMALKCLISIIDPQIFHERDTNGRTALELAKILSCDHTIVNALISAGVTQ